MSEIEKKFSPPDLDIVHAKSLDEIEREVLILATLGKTIVEAAVDLQCTEDVIKTNRSNILEKWDVKNMAEASNYGILGGVVDIEVEDRRLRLRTMEILLLRTYASGGHNGDFANILGSNNEARIAESARALFEKIGATGKTHSVRRSYELGIFNVNSKQTS